MKTCHEEMRQFTIVARMVLKHRGGGACNVGGRGRKGVSLIRIGVEEFGLTPYQVQLCTGYARDQLDEICHLDRVRKGGVFNKPTSSDQLEAIELRKLHLKPAA